MTKRNKQKRSLGSKVRMSVTTLMTDIKIPPAKYESGFKKVDSKSARAHA